MKHPGAFLWLILLCNLLAPYARVEAQQELAGTLWKLEDGNCGEDWRSFYSLLTFLPDGKLRESSGRWRLTGNHLVIESAKDLNIEQMKVTLQNNQMKGKANFGLLPGMLRAEAVCVRLIKLAQNVPIAQTQAPVSRAGTIEGTVIGTLDGPSTMKVIVEAKGIAYHLLLYSRQHEAKIVGDDVRADGTRVRATYTSLAKMGVGGYEGKAVRVIKLAAPTQTTAPNQPKQSFGQTLKAGVREAFKGVLKPQPDSSATNEPSTPGKQLSLPFEDHGACPFECCTYRRWTVSVQTVVRRDRQDNAPAAFTLRRGEKVIALTGVVITMQPGQAKVLKPLTITGQRVKPGEIIYLLTYLGEGDYKLWYKGQLGDADLDETIAKVVKEPQSIWWVKVKNSKGQIGWTTQTKNFTGLDACG